MAKIRVTTRQIGGNDGYQWCVLVDGRVKWNGMTRREARFRAERETQAINIAEAQARILTIFNRDRIADHIDGYDRDDLGESPDY